MNPDQSWEVLRARRDALRALCALAVLLALFVAAIGTAATDAAAKSRWLLAAPVSAGLGFVLSLRARAMNERIAAALAAPEPRRGERA